MKRVFLISLAVVLAISISVVGCGEPADDTIELVFATPNTGTYPPVEAIIQGLESIEEESGGRVEFTVYHTGSLIGWGEAVQGLLEGACDLSTEGIGSYPGRFPLTDVMFLSPYWLEAEDVVYDWDFFQEHLKDLEEWDGIKVLWWSTAPCDALMSTPQVRTLEDVQGLRVWTFGRNTDIFTALGASPTPVSFPEIYDAMDKGLLDGIFADPCGLLTRSWYEVVDYILPLPIAPANGPLMMNADVYDGLPDDIKLLFDELHVELNSIGPSIQEAYIDDSIQACLDVGGTLTELSTNETAIWLNAAFNTSALTWAAQMDAAGYNGTELMETRMEFLATYMPELFALLDYEF